MSTSRAKNTTNDPASAQTAAPRPALRTNQHRSHPDEEDIPALLARIASMESEIEVLKNAVKESRAEITVLRGSTVKPPPPPSPSRAKKSSSSVSSSASSSSSSSKQPPSAPIDIPSPISPPTSPVKPPLPPNSPLGARRSRPTDSPTKSSGRRKSSSKSRLPPAPAIVIPPNLAAAAAIAADNAASPRGASLNTATASSSPSRGPPTQSLNTPTSSRPSSRRWSTRFNKPPLEGLLDDEEENNNNNTRTMADTSAAPALKPDLPAELPKTPRRPSVTLDVPKTPKDGSRTPRKSRSASVVSMASSSSWKTGSVKRLIERFSRIPDDNTDPPPPSPLRLSVVALSETPPPPVPEPPSSPKQSLRANSGRSPVVKSTLSSINPEEARPISGGLPNTPYISNPASVSLCTEFEPTRAALVHALAQYSGDPLRAELEEARITHDGVAVAYGKRITRVHGLSNLGDARPSLVHCLILTTAPLELFAMARLLAVCGEIHQVFDGPWVYYIGQMGDDLRIVLVKSTRGTVGAHSAGPTVTAAIREWSPRFLVAAGCATGTDPKETAYGDVLVASAVFDADHRLVDSEGRIDYTWNTLHDVAVPMSNAFSSSNLSSWAMHGSIVSGSLNAVRRSRVHHGLIASGHVLTSQGVWVQGLTNAVKQVVESRGATAGPVMGGEAEGGGLFEAAANFGVPCALVKGICSFGGADGGESSPAATAYAAVSASSVVIAAIARDGGDWVRRLPVPAGKGVAPINDNIFIDRATAGYVSRSHMDAAFGTYLAKKLGDDYMPEDSAVLITGEAGAGKTTWLANLILEPRFAPRIMAHHFCRHDNPASVDPRKFLANISARILARMGDERASIADIGPNTISAVMDDVSKSIAPAFKALFASLPEDLPDSVPASQQPLLIIVDGLDAAPAPLVAALADGAGVAPPWLRVVMSARTLEDLPAPFPCSTLHMEPEDNKKDLRMFVASHTHSSKDVSPVVAASNGNFLYGRLLLDYAVLGSVANITKSPLPATLQDLYTAMARQIWPTKEEFVAAKPVLSVLVAAKGPVPRSIIDAAANTAARAVGASQRAAAAFRAAKTTSSTSITTAPGSPQVPPSPTSATVLTNAPESPPGLSPKEVGSVLRALSGVLETFNGSLVIRHSSFLEWALNVGWGAASPVDPRGGHAALAWTGLHLWRHSSYAVSNTLYHAVHAKAPRLLSIVCADMALRWEWMTAKADINGLNALTTDLIAAGSHAKTVGRILFRWRSKGLRGAGDMLLHHLTGNAIATPLAVLAEDLRAERIFAPVRGRRIHTSVDARMVGHTHEKVNAVAQLPDGRIASAGNDGTVRIWDSESFQEEMVLRGHDGSVNCLLVLPEHGTLLSGGDDKTIRVWNLTTGKADWDMERHEDAVTAMVAISSSTIATAGMDATVRVWRRLSTGRFVNTKVMEGHKRWVFGIAVLNDGTDRVATVGYDDTVRIWDTSDGTLWATLRGHDKDVRGVGVLADGRIVSTGHDKTVLVWKTDKWNVPKDKTPIEIDEDPTAYTKWEGHADWNICLSVLPDGRHVATGSDDRTIRIWDSMTGKTVRTLRGHSAAVTSVISMADGRFASCGRDHTVMIWSAAPLRGSGSTSASASGDGASVSSGDSGSSVSNMVVDKSGHASDLSAVAVLDDGRVVTAGDDGSIQIWSPDSSEVLAVLSGHTRPINSLYVVPDSAAMTFGGKTLLSGSQDGSVKIWVETPLSPSVATAAADSAKDAAAAASSSWTCVKTMNQAHKKGVTHVSLSGNRAKLITCGADRRVRAWTWPKCETMERALKVPRGEWTPLCSANVDATRLAVGGSDGVVRVWEVNGGKLERTLYGHSAPVRDVVVTEDQRYVVSASDDKHIRVWDMSRAPGSGDVCVAALEGHRHAVSALTVLGSRYIVSGSAQGATLRVWDIHTGSEVSRIEIDDAVRDLAFDETRGVVTVGQLKSWSQFVWTG